MIRKFHEAKIAGTPSVTLWGSGTLLREFLHTDVLANACTYLLECYGVTPINVGWGRDISISDLAVLIAQIIGFEGQIQWENSKPDGTPRKLLDSRKINSLAWEPSISLRDGIESTCEWYRSQGN